MNKLTGYGEFTLKSGRVLELKFGNGASEIYSKLQGFTTMSEIQKSLNMPEVVKVDENGWPVLDGEGKPVKEFGPTPDYLKALRLYAYSAALFAARVQNKAVEFNEWEAANWLEELGFDVVFGLLDQPSQAQVEEAKKKKAPLIRATQ